MARVKDAETALNLPPGFRFHPTDEELVVYYLCRKAAHHRLPAPIIAEVDLYKYDPWQLPDKALFGQQEWYFFTPRERKYPKGTRPNRAAGSGYWKATGADRPVTPAGCARPLGIKKALVFYAGKSPSGVKTNWIMHEYRLADANRAANKEGQGGGISLRLDDWVLCRLYNKKNTWEQTPLFQAEAVSVGDATDLFELPEDTCSDSLRTLESDVDNDVHPELRGHGNPFGIIAPQVPNADVAGGGDQVAGGIKEDDDWFGDLNLESLGSSSGPPTSMDFGYQDYLASLASPHLKPGHDTLPPF